MKYFVISDIHSFYTEMISALKKAGFRKTNKEHVLIVCGDLFDRGSETVEVYNYIHSIPKSRRILIRGNHEELYLDLLTKDFPESHDFHNHTVDTFCHIANFNIECLNEHYGIEYLGDSMTNSSYIYWNQIKSIVKTHKITKWLKSKEWKDYYELDDKFIFVHSFIPTKLKEEYSMLKYFPASSLKPSCFEYDKDWRTGYWGDARWGCPFAEYKEGFFKPEEDLGKTLVCGHWHTSDFYKHLKNCDWYENTCSPIYYSKGLIGIDGGCMYNRISEEFIHPQNVLVIEDGECYAYDEDTEKLEKLQEMHENTIIKTVTDSQN